MSTTLVAAPRRRSAGGEGTDDTDLVRLDSSATRPRRHALEATSFIPAVRPFSGSAGAEARARIALSDSAVTANNWVLEEGLRRLDRARRAAIVTRWLRPDPGGAAPLVVDSGCDVRIGGTMATEPLRSALLRWLPCPTTDIALLEDGVFAGAPANALALLLRPPTIWSSDEAATAERHFPGDSAFASERFAAIERYARSRVDDSHCSRVLEAAERITATLPSAGFPLAYSILAEGCRLVSDDADRCAAAAARQLARFAMSVRTTRMT